MSHFRFRYIVRGGHTHIRLFAGKNRELTHGKCGEFIMDNKEWDDFRYRLGGMDEFEFLAEFIEPAPGWKRTREISS